MKIEMTTITKSALLMLLVGCISCASPNNTAVDNEPSLYQQIGEKPAIDKIIDNLVNIIGQDEVVFAHFAQSNVTNFKEKLSVYLCHITDGPCQYNGDTMQDIHRGMYIDTNQFNHFVELFISAMDEANISYPIQNQLLARLAPLRESIFKM
ncbi:group 1 truncated hemoglobin [Colwellia sp. 6M3]|jgi:hemoglobin|uniref:group I truncated hemoglobin n=1 Tax=Colwellia sp. 6M3 TaxID=2759849 RepID=UPI0015F45CA8|nr:group 1 truncated hemoglobin [Colwellia sp. 6M3]MBA6417357.1 group 1 truncated hemoglobin [Colwellia sp. 6M3]|tara:strand:+ start:2939 stop:3394 length:456 start_codon:yes stop_codon:yes gene_type:complete